MKKRVLVIEDNARLLQAISLFLSKGDFAVMTARDAEEALIKIAETIPDIIVSDIMLPGRDGFSFASEIRGNPRTDLIPLIFLTAKDSTDDRIAGFKAGVDAYLTKPFEPNELLAVIENILHRVSLTHTRIAKVSHEVTAYSEEIQVKEESPLTDAEKRVARLVAKTYTNKEIAAHLNLSVRTIEMHISNILSKMGWSNRVEIARYVIEKNLFD